MKVIDLLNMISKGEEVPKKVKYKNKIYEWKEYDCGYEKKRKIDWVKEHGYVAEENRTYFYLKHCYQDLNDEVEIIEEKEMCHKCGKYPAEYNQTYCEFCLGISEEDKKIEKIGANNYKWNYKYDKKTHQAVVDNLELVRQKINEIIDYINGSDKE